MITAQDRTSLLSSITIFLNHLEGDGKERVLSPERLNWMAENLTDFITNASVKFYRGQQEHGNNLEERNLDSEIFLETLDLFWYNRAKVNPLLQGKK